MQPQLVKIIIIVCILGALGVAGLFAVEFLMGSGQTPVSESSSNPNTPSPGSTQTVTVPSQNGSQPSTQSPALTNPNISAEYQALFQKILGTAPVFIRVNASSTGDSANIYGLYGKQISIAEQTFAASNPSLGVSMTDLTGDGIPEALVINDLPGFCGTGGCTLDVYKKQNGKWTNIFSILAQGEVGLSNALTNGYKDLFISVSGEDGGTNKVVRYIWDGKIYQAGETMAAWDGTTFQVAQ